MDEKTELKDVEITSVEIIESGDCVILDLIIPPTQLKIDHIPARVEKPKSGGRHLGSGTDEFLIEK